MKKCPIIKAKCPESADGCPCWTETVFTREDTGEVSVVRECVFQALPKLMIHVAASVGGVQSAVESNRNELAQGLGQLVQIARVGVPDREDRKKVTFDG